jgi:vancomycin resistance protein YoaR
MKDGIQINREIKKTGVSAAKPKRRTGVTAGIITGAVVILLAVGMTVAGFFINKLDTIYPNVAAGGIDLSGMTVDEATKALTDAGYENNASNVAVTVNFPNGEMMTITGEESGLKLNAEGAAKAAYEHGRGGSFFVNEIGYIKSMFNIFDLERSGAVNEDYVRSIVGDYTKKFNEMLINTAYKITDDSITITKGRGAALADENALFELVMTSLDQSAAQNSPVTVDYAIETSGDQDIDLQGIYDSIITEPVDAIYDTTTNLVTQSVPGISFDLDEAKKAFDAAKAGATVTITLIKTEPAGTTVQLQSLLFRDILSEKATYVAGTSNRVHNVKLAAAAMNGKILNPGDTFSYNETLGKRTTEKGYLEAGAYVGGKTVQEIGGGICQGSSTLYFCVLYADLEVVERSNHMFSVAYLPLGTDATVNWGTVDFKFKNNTDYPIKIEAFLKDGYLNIKLHGTKVNENYVKIVSVPVSDTPIKTVEKEDATIAPGTTKVDQDGHTGHVVDTYKYIYDKDGNELSKTSLGRNTYRMQEKVILVPVGTTTPSPTDGVTPSESPSTPSPSDTASPGESPSPSDVSPSETSPSTSPSLNP